MFGKRILSEAWRPGRMALSACLRSVGDEANYYHQLSPRVGGPPG
ncbi:hypothetical protein GCM10009742_45880 [Kribbella karoonensis]|uniref:Uncharacterized protein n=1 Tax=Kribbella karoonensis TaxID=324851 RepID=A0ABN2E2Z6_9ACTN